MPRWSPRMRQLLLLDAALGGGAAVPGALSGAILGTAAVVAAMTVGVSLVGSVAGAGTVNAAMTVAVPLAGAVAGAGVAAATITNTAGYDTASTAYFAAMAVQPDATRKGLIDTFIKGLKTDGVWANLDALWIFASQTSQQGLLNAVNPAGAAGSTVNAPTFTLDRGFAGDGATSYVDTNFTAPSGTLNSVSFGEYINAGNTSSGSSVFGAFDAGTFGNTCNPNNSGSALFRANTGTSQTTAGTSTTYGFTAINRDTSTSSGIYKNGSSLGTSTNASTSIPTTNYLHGKINTSFSNCRGALQFVGRNLTSTQHGNFYSRVNTFLTAIGAN